jgi:ribosomal protein S11
MITLIIKSSMHKFIWTFVNKLNYFGILIDRVIIARRIPHNGMRVRKKRRV